MKSTRYRTIKRPYLVIIFIITIWSFLLNGVVLARADSYGQPPSGAGALLRSGPGVLRPLARAERESRTMARGVSSGALAELFRKIMGAKKIPERIGQKNRVALTALINMAADLTGSRIFIARGWDRLAWFSSQLKEEGIGDPGAYLASIRGPDGAVRPECRTAATAMFNRILLRMPLDLIAQSYISTRIDRNPGEYRYFEEIALPAIISEKIRLGDRRLRIKVVGSSTGEEMASIYSYLKRAFEANKAAWGRIDDWDIEIHSIDVLKDIIRAGEQILYDDPDALVGMQASPGIINDIKALSAEQRKRLFKFTHGNIADSSERQAFLSGADAIFANTIFYLITVGSREEIVGELLRRYGSSWIFTDHSGLYENCAEDRTAIEVPGEIVLPVRSYVIGPQGTALEQPDPPPLVFERYMLDDCFDRAGEFLPTHAFFNSVMRRQDYDRAAHVASVAGLVADGKLRLPPTTIKGLEVIVSMKDVSPEYQKMALRLLGAYTASREYFPDMPAVDLAGILTPLVDAADMKEVGHVVDNAKGWKDTVAVTIKLTDNKDIADAQAPQEVTLHQSVERLLQGAGITDGAVIFDFQLVADELYANILEHSKPAAIDRGREVFGIAVVQVNRSAAGDVAVEFLFQDNGRGAGLNKMFRRAAQVASDDRLQVPSGRGVFLSYVCIVNKLGGVLTFASRGHTVTCLPDITGGADMPYQLSQGANIQNGLAVRGSFTIRAAVPARPAPLLHDPEKERAMWNGV